MSWRQYRPIEYGEFLCIGADTSQGGNDYSAAVFVSQTNLDIPLVYHSPTMATDMTTRLYPVLERIYDTTQVAPVIAYERNAGGVFEFERLALLNRANKYRLYTMMTYGTIDKPEETKYGWDTNTATRPKMLSDFKEAVDNHLLRLYDKPLISELYSFIINKQGKPEAESSSHDDLIMAAAIAWQLQQSERPRSDSYHKPYVKGKWAIS